MFAFTSSSQHIRIWNVAHTRLKQHAIHAKLENLNCNAMWLEVFCTVSAILCSVWAVGRYLLVVNDFVYIPTTRKRHSWRSIKLLSSVRVSFLHAAATNR